ncbi:hypothetical protein Pan241w_11390 [Gimesia alba]|uniref:Uncharacterized protein n=1 Tax=Gimesia alba TaxID=2527973 RepID=A0A517RB17_9PLAN|nr:hypothetical protein Pan241w_11390 [Gimesia alba]
MVDMKNAGPHGYSQTYIGLGQSELDPRMLPDASVEIAEINSLRRRAVSIKPIITLPWGTVWFHYIDSGGKVIGTTVQPPGGCEILCASISEERRSCETNP